MTNEELHYPGWTLAVITMAGLFLKGNPLFPEEVIVRIGTGI